MSVTYSHHAYYGNDGKLLSGGASLAKGFALIRSHQNIAQQLPNIFQGLPKTFFNERLLDSELKKRKHLFLFSIVIAQKFPLPLFEGDTMRSGNQDFGAWSNIIFLSVEDEEEDQSPDDNKHGDFDHQLTPTTTKARYPTTPIPPRKPHYA